MSGTTSPDPVDTAYSSWQYDVQETNYLQGTQLVDQKQRLENLLALMGQVPATVAFNLLIPAAMLMVSNQNTTNMEIQSSQSNEEADVLTLINITQADNNYLASNSAAYQAACADPTAPGNQDIIDDYNDKYAEAQKAQNDLLSMFDANSDDSPDNPYYGWCDTNYASTMISAINSWQSATNDLSTKETDDPSAPSGSNSDAYYYSLHMQEYAQDPASSTYALDVSNLSTSINTESSSNNSVQSQIQGIIKALMTAAQQYEGSTKSAGKSIIQEKDYWVQQQRSS